MRRLFFRVVLAGGAAGMGCAHAADLKHDLYICANLSGQGQVLGSRGAVKSGIHRSRDRQTFEHVGPHHIRMFTLTHDPHEPPRLFIASMDGVLRTHDRGATWPWRIVTSWDMTEPKAIACDPNARGHVYAGLPDGIAVSSDGGQSWTRRHEGIRRGYTATIVVDRTRAGRVLAGTEKGIFLSEDGAANWRLVQATEKTVYHVRQSPHAANVFFAVTWSDGAFRSDDGGNTWRRIAGVPADRTLHNCDFDVAEAQRIVLCGWGTGVRLSDDGGKTWQDRSAGLPNREIWRVAFDPDIPGRLYAAPHLKPVHVSEDLGRTWRPYQFETATVFDIVFVPKS